MQTQKNNELYRSQENDILYSHLNKCKTNYIPPIMEMYEIELEKAIAGSVKPGVAIGNEQVNTDWNSIDSTQTNNDLNW